MKRRYDFTDIPNDRLREEIARWIKNERNRAILERHLIDGRTYDQLAEEFYVSRRQIARIIMHAENQLFTKIK